MTRRIDSHVHLWRIDRGDYRWITRKRRALYRDFGTDDLQPLLNAAGVDEVVLVQAAETVAETEFLLEIANSCPFVSGVVGWIDLAAADAPTVLRRLAMSPYLKGIRPMLQDIAETEWILRPELTPALEAVIDHELAFDCLVQPRHLDCLLQLLQRHRELRAVICHGAKPDIAADAFDPWAAGMRRLARETGAFCKLSGLITEAGTSWSTDRLKRYVELLLGEFGPDRLLWGSDWPVLSETASYDDWWRATRSLLQDRSDDDRVRILGQTAITAYRL